MVVMQIDLFIWILLDDWGGGLNIHLYIVLHWF